MFKYFGIVTQALGKDCAGSNAYSISGHLLTCVVSLNSLFLFRFVLVLEKKFILYTLYIIVKWFYKVYSSKH